MDDETNKATARKAKSLNGIGRHEEKSQMVQRRRRDTSSAHPSMDWRLLLSGNQLGFFAVVISILSALYTAGWIPGIAKSTDVTELSQQIVAVKSGVDRLASEFSATRVEIVRASTSIARLEGRLEAGQTIKRVPARPKPAPAPIKAKGLFD